MKLFIKNEYVDLEKFHNFYYDNEQLVLRTINCGGSISHWAEKYIDMTKKEYDDLCNMISNHDQIPQLFNKQLKD